MIIGNQSNNEYIITNLKIVYKIYGFVENMCKICTKQGWKA